LPKVPSD